MSSLMQWARWDSVINTVSVLKNRMLIQIRRVTAVCGHFSSTWKKFSPIKNSNELIFLSWPETRYRVSRNSLIVCWRIFVLCIGKLSSVANVAFMSLESMRTLSSYRWENILQGKGKTQKYWLCDSLNGVVPSDDGLHTTILYSWVF